MKRSLLIATIAFAALSAGAQSFTVINKNGEKTGFNNSEVESIEFSTSSLDPAPVLQTIDFGSVMESIEPAEGLVDLTANPKGIGRISINLDGVFMIDEKASHEVVLADTEKTIFSRRPNAQGMYLNRDVMTNKTSFTYEFAVDGFTTPGFYHLYIPEGTYTDTKGNPLGATSRVYYIEVPAPAQTYVATPAPGTVEKLEEITFKFENYPVVDATVGAKVYVRKGSNTNPEAIISPVVGADGTVTLSVSPSISAPGAYNVIIPAGTFSLRTEQGAKSYMNKEISLIYEIEGAAQLPPKVGDFYYSDGSWSTLLVDKGDVKPIGVIFYLGAANTYKDNASNYTVKDGSKAMDEFHGYVVALRDATVVDNYNESVNWGPFNDSNCRCSSETDDFLGYNNTKAIRARADQDFGGLSNNNNNFPATWYATEYFESQVPAPAQSSGWFLPSAGQLKYIWEKVYFDPNNGDENAAYVEKSLRQLSEMGGAEMYVRDSEYWTSTEKYDNYGNSYRAYYVCFDESNFLPGFVADYNKNTGMKVRSILAF